nr:hypothetical protein [Enterococcus faecalis]
MRESDWSSDVCSSDLVHDDQLSKNYYEFIPSDFDIALVEAIATEKSKYTNNNNQYDEGRTPEEKKNKQF